MTLTLSIQTVKDFLDKYEWKYDNLNENSIVTGFAGENSEFTVFIKADGDWIICSVSPFVEQPKPDCYLNIFTYLIRLNFYATLVKFAIDEKDNILLNVELPATGLTFDAFVASLEALCFYADDQHKTVLELATNPNAKPPSLSNR